MTRSLAGIRLPPQAQILLSLLVAVGWLLLLEDQLPRDNRVARCWFYNPALQELSLSEIASVLFWLLAAGIAARRGPWNRHGVLAALCLICALEEANYGVPYVSVLIGDYTQGSSLHNQWEAADSDSFYLVETLVKLGFFVVLYPTIAVLAYRRSRSRLRTVPYALPALLYAMTLIRGVSYNLTNYPGTLYQSVVEELHLHPCLWTLEELQELLLAGAVLLWTALGAPEVPEDPES